ncbi:vacuolar protein sorting-associated protein 72-like protein [Huso huso]|uniref:Vacuolar protein sorting-associated protein 72-like protein n=1 Tax=Huso huso TaxID=61971 RepID=A0ABR0Y3S9_HUSHU
MSVAESRAQRKTAGNLMSKLLDAEEEDEFYKTTYGGFNEESGDDEYKSDQSASEDEVDSDFDIDEGAEPDSDQEESEPKRKRRVVTKAYKEPLKAAKPNPKARKAWAQPSGSEKVKEEKREPFELQGDVGENRKSVRQSTTEHTRLTYLRLQERQVQPRRRKGPHHDRPLTQEELLAEAKITAEINLRSLENYERLEADKKKQVHKKRRCDGPLVRFHSVLTPLVSETHLKEETVDVEGLDQDPQQQPTPPQHRVSGPPPAPHGAVRSNLHHLLRRRDLRELLPPSASPPPSGARDLPRDSQASPVPRPHHRHPLLQHPRLQDHPRGVQEVRDSARAPQHRGRGSGEPRGPQLQRDPPENHH